MLESISSARLNSAVKFAEWSPKMDVIAIVYDDVQDAIELRRMDWTKVNTIALGSPATALCFGSDGRSICAATLANRLWLFGIERSAVRPWMDFPSTVTCVHMGSCNGISITIVAFSDATVSVFSDFHLSLAAFEVASPAIQISLSGTTVFLLLDDGRTISRFDLPFVLNHSEEIQATSSALSSYWFHRETIENARLRLEEIWKRIWGEAAPFTSHGIELAKSFLCGRPPPELSTEVHRSRVKKSIAADLSKMKNILAAEIIPSYLQLDKYSETLQAALDIALEVGISLSERRSQPQLRNCLSMIENCKKLDACFTALFDYLQNGPDTIFSVSTPEFAEFLVDYLCGFELLDIRIGEGPVSHPVFSAEEQPDLQLPNRYSRITNAECICLATGVSVIDLTIGDAKEYEVDGQPLAGYAFDDGAIGCFYETDGQVNFVMLNAENAAPHEVSLLDATRFVISPRRIAFVEPTQGFCAVVDLQAAADEEEQAHQPRDE
jgi:hypothetical protein